MLNLPDVTIISQIYESANSLVYSDLEKCLNQLQDTGNISNFVLGDKDL
ncbi:MAG: hypothetical protein RSE13_00345 [Planktothrix sp. GU0601_MAG3]|nr:MAG: hypothetical protein RSE13_00345 [Planktothrix sp. GU0601_MAG3]